MRKQLHESFVMQENSKALSVMKRMKRNLPEMNNIYYH